MKKVNLNEQQAKALEDQLTKLYERFSETLKAEYDSYMDNISAAFKNAGVEQGDSLSNEFAAHFLCFNGLVTPSPSGDKSAMRLYSQQMAGCEGSKHALLESWIKAGEIMDGLAFAGNAGQYFSQGAMRGAFERMLAGQE